MPVWRGVLKGHTFSVPLGSLFLASRAGVRDWVVTGIGLQQWNYETKIQPRMGRKILAQRFSAG